jgi:uncharacterized protein YcbK (DUF882 family)
MPPPRAPAPLRASVVAAYSFALLLGTVTPAQADVQHVVARGHTLLSIAHRYHVSVKAILDANHLKDPNHLKVGSTLVIPGVMPAASLKAKIGIDGKKGGPEGSSTYAMRPKTPGVVHATRLATNEDFTVRVTRRGHPSPTALKTFEQMARNGAGLTHPMDPRLVALVGVVSDHFGSRRLEIISGYRPYTSTQYTRHSNHNIGNAVDFRIVGVPNEVLRDYCRTLRDVGVGYYPNSTFVHLDVRTTPAFWIDYSRPGEPPRYNVPNADADEGTSDVSEEGQALETPPSTPPPAHGPTPLFPAPTVSATPAPSSNSDGSSVPSAVPPVGN